MNWITMLWSAIQSQTFWRAKWASGSTGSGCDRIPVELFRTTKGGAIKVFHSIWQQIWKTQQWSQDWKRSILIPVPTKKSSIEECANLN